MLLRLNRNRILYQNIVRRPARMASKLEYELKKHLRIRLDGLTIRQVALLEREIIPAADKTLAAPAPAYRGRRPDHASLPADIQQLYEDNGTIFRKLRQTRETLRTMENAEPCDRYELCKILGELDRKYHANWETYDHYVPTPAATAESAANAATTTKRAAKKKTTTTTS